MLDLRSGFETSLNADKAELQPKINPAHLLGCDWDIGQ